MLLNYHRQIYCSRSIGNRRHRLDTNVPLPTEGMTIQARATRRRGIIEVNELRHRRMSRQKICQIGQRIGTTCKHMASVDADAKARIVDLGDKGSKLRPFGEDLSALTRGRLQEQRTVGRRIFESDQSVCAHMGHRRCEILGCGFADMDNDAPCACCRAVTEILPQERSVIIILLARWRAEIDEIRAVDEPPTVHLEGRRSSRGQLCISDLEAG